MAPKFGISLSFQIHPGWARPGTRRIARAWNRAGLIVAPLIELQHLARQIKSFDDEAERQNAGPLPHALMREVLVRQLRGQRDQAAQALHRPCLSRAVRA